MNWCTELNVNSANSFFLFQHWRFGSFLFLEARHLLELFVMSDAIEKFQYFDARASIAGVISIVRFLWFLSNIFNCVGAISKSFESMSTTSSCYFLLPPSFSLSLLSPPTKMKYGPFISCSWGKLSISSLVLASVFLLLPKEVWLSLNPQQLY